MVNIDLLKQLREETGISMMECKKALEQTGGDLEKARQVLRERGKELTKNREGRALSKGVIDAYIHPGSRIGVLIELLCESDFAAKSEPFIRLAHELCLHIAAAKPLFVRPEDIPEQTLEQERQIYAKQIEGANKPLPVVQQIIEGKLAKYKQETVLMCQAWVKDSSKTIQSLITETEAQIGEKISISKFCRFEL